MKYLFQLRKIEISFSKSSQIELIFRKLEYNSLKQFIFNRINSNYLETMHFNLLNVLKIQQKELQQQQNGSVYHNN